MGTSFLGTQALAQSVCWIRCGCWIKILRSGGQSAMSPTADVVVDKVVQVDPEL